MENRREFLLLICPDLIFLSLLLFFEVLGERAQAGDRINVRYLKEDSAISNGVIAVYKIIPLEENE